jgi:small-conductance mechanosensitive channel
LLLGRIWNIDLERIIGASMGQRVAEAVFTIIVTLILASVAWGLVKAAIQRHAPDKGFDVSKLEEAEGGGGIASRVQTITVLFGRFVLVTLVVIATLVVLSSLGINIGPLLAGAGVVGLAIGFGAQTLVRDIITGVFLLLEDAFRVGEYVDVGIARGTVESVSVRSMRLRHHLGPIHTVPFGAINNLTNYSRDWAIMKLDLRLPFDTDLEKVRKLVKRLGQEMLADPAFRDSFLQPLKSQGATRMDDDAFIVRVKFMARPGEQFVLRREVFRRIQEAFQKNGIRFAPRRVIVDNIGGNSSADDRAAAAALATQTLQREPKITASDDRS